MSVPTIAAALSSSQHGRGMRLRVTVAPLAAIIAMTLPSCCGWLKLSEMVFSVRRTWTGSQSERLACAVDAIMRIWPEPAFGARRRAHVPQ